MTDSAAGATEEDRNHAWWQGWWDADFSWDGLAQKVWEGWLVLPDGSVVEAPQDSQTTPAGARQATLQDYWRDQKDDLIASPDGAIRFTRIHLPPEWDDGTPTGKTDWTDEGLDELLGPKLAAASETKFDQARELIGADRRAQMQGTVLLATANFTTENGRPLSARFDAAAFLRYANFSSRSLISARFDGAVFFRGANFEHVALNGYTSFKGACFTTFVSFENGTFESDTDFEAAIFVSLANYKGATFAGLASFEGAIFRDYILLDKATFAKDANFRAAKLSSSASFGDATFKGRVVFEDATFGGHSSFSDATFAGDVLAASVSFADFALFDRVAFSGDARFDSATFADYASFDGAFFVGDAVFYRAKFTSTASFMDTNFLSDASFKLAQFNALAQFDNASFGKDGKGGRMNFRDAVFASTTKFFRTTFPTRLDHFGSAFSGVRFKDFVDFTGAGTHWVAALNDVIFEKAVSLPRPSEKYANREFNNVILPAVRTAVLADAERETETTPETHRLWRLQQIEGGCRALKNALGRDRDEILEQRYYRFQLLARRKQANVPWTEKAFSFLYDWFGNYGASIGRPFIGVLALTLAFTVIYWGLDIGWGNAASHALAVDPTATLDPALEQSLSFSASRIFPFGPFDDLSKSWLSAYESGHGALPALGLRILASFQTALALTLAFMLGLAVRRKFQIT